MATDTRSRLIIEAQDKTASAFNSVQGRVKGLTSSFNLFKVAVAGVSASLPVLIAKSGAESAAELNKLSVAFGVSTEQAQRLQFAAELGDTSLQSLQRAALQLNQALADLGRGKGTDAVKALDSLNISAADLRATGGDLEQMITLVGGRFAELPAGADRAQIAVDLFGRKLAAEVLPAVLSFAENAQAAQRDLAAFGLTLDELDLSKADLMGDQFDRIKNLARATSIVFAGTLAPTVAALMNTFRDLTEEERKTGDEGLEVGTHIAAGVAVALDAFDALDDFITLLRIGFKQMQIEASSFADNFAFLQKVPTVSPVIGSLKLLQSGISQSSNSTAELSDEIDALFRSLEADQKTRLGSRFFDEYLKTAQEMKTKLKETFAGGLGIEEGLTEAERKEREALRKRLEGVLESLATEQERLELAFNEQLETLRQGRAAQELTEQEFQAERLRAEAKFQQDLRKLKEKEEEPLRRQREQAQQRLQQILESHATELEQVELRLTTELEILDENHELGLLSEAEYQQHRAFLIQTAEENINTIREEARKRDAEAEKKARDEKLAALEEIIGIEQQTISDLLNFQNLNLQGQLQTVASFGAALTGQFASHSKKAFELHKKFALAEALISGFKAVQDAFAWGMKLGGPPLAGAFAAAAAIKTASQVAAIRSQQPGGGGSVSSGGGGIAGSSLSRAGGGATVGEPEIERTGVGNVTILLQGKKFDREDVEELVLKINELAADNGNLNFRTV